MRWTVAAALALAMLAGSCSRCPWARPRPELTAIEAPESFAPGETHPVLLVRVVGENLDPENTSPLALQIVDAEGQEADAGPVHVPLVSDLALGRDTVGIAFSPEVGAGAVRICARAEGVRGQPCAQLALQPDWWPRDEEAAEEEIQRQDEVWEQFRRILRTVFPRTGCECVSATIRMTAGEEAHEPLEFPPFHPARGLGPWTAGSADEPEELPRPHARWLISARRSTMRFEAHFEYRITNPPTPEEVLQVPEAKRPQIAKSLASLCREGQNVNATYYWKDPDGRLQSRPLRVRSPGSDEDEEAEAFPYETNRRPETLTRDGWGYSAPAVASNGESEIKSHDPDAQDALQGVIHWIDAPGGLPEGHLGARTEAFYHAYVHGSDEDGSDDDCDCYFGIRTGVYDDEGGPVDPSVLVAPGEPCS